MHKRRSTSIPLEYRFLQKFRIGLPDQCWEWEGQKTFDGYGQLALGPSLQRIYAHRYAYMLYHGITLPAGQSRIVMHTCDNPGCVNPNHLQLGTMGDNLADMRHKGRSNPRSLKGSLCKTAKLSDEIVPLLRRRIADGEVMTHIAKELGVSLTAISYMWHRKTWTHVP